jgi:ketosteroid isomerase-like protein
MPGHCQRMRGTFSTLALFCLTFVPAAVADPLDCLAHATAPDCKALQATDDGIHAGFARADIDAIMAYHHPLVVKALSPDKLLTGRRAVAADLGGTLRSTRLEFVENRVESLVVNGDTAVEMTNFAIKGTPRSGGDPFLFKGRTMVVYVRYASSPSGWATLREIIQR